jgi:hypothetical protein
MGELRPPRPHGWNEWYRFARDELGYAHAESVEYANLRYVEERNRERGIPAERRR